MARMKLCKTCRAICIIDSHMQRVHILVHPKAVELELLISFKNVGTAIARVRGVFLGWGIALGGRVSLKMAPSLPNMVQA